MKTEIIVRLVITSAACTGEQFSKAIPLQPDRQWRPGDRRLGSRIIEKTHGWVLGSGLGRSEQLEIQIEKLLRNISPYEKAIRKLSRSAEIYLSCVIYSKTPPALFFDKALISRLHALGASLDVDLYIG